jgi:hypothetical protein
VDEVDDWLLGEVSPCLYSVENDLGLMSAKTQIWYSGAQIGREGSNQHCGREASYIRSEPVIGSFDSGLDATRIIVVNSGGDGPHLLSHLEIDNEKLRLMQ